MARTETTYYCKTESLNHVVVIFILHDDAIPSDLMSILYDCDCIRIETNRRNDSSRQQSYNNSIFNVIGIEYTLLPIFIDVIIC